MVTHFHHGSITLKFFFLLHMDANILLFESVFSLMNGVLWFGDGTVLSICPYFNNIDNDKF